MLLIRVRLSDSGELLLDAAPRHHQRFLAQNYCPRTPLAVQISGNEVRVFARRRDQLDLVVSGSRRGPGVELSIDSGRLALGHARPVLAAALHLVVLVAADLFHATSLAWQCDRRIPNLLLRSLGHHRSGSLLAVPSLLSQQLCNASDFAWRQSARCGAGYFSTKEYSGLTSRLTKCLI